MNQISVRLSLIATLNFILATERPAPLTTDQGIADYLCRMIRMEELRAQSR